MLIFSEKAIVEENWFSVDWLFTVLLEILFSVVCPLVGYGVEAVSEIAVEISWSVLLLEFCSEEANGEKVLALA